jgi:hypothetical protein
MARSILLYDLIAGVSEQNLQNLDRHKNISLLVFRKAHVKYHILRAVIFHSRHTAGSLCGKAVYRFECAGFQRYIQSEIVDKDHALFKPLSRSKRIMWLAAAGAFCERWVRTKISRNFTANG